jgi:hypothetical protein
MLTIFEPDDFADRPYVGGLNQMGHATLGAALVGVLAFALHPSLALVAGGLAIIALEGWQLHKRGATLADYWIDLCYWLTGGAFWAGVLLVHDLPPVVQLAPLWACLIFVLEYVRIKRAMG